MKNSFTEKLDPQAIRQGLLSIRKSQIQLLNQLKSETMQLKKSPIRFELSTEGSTQQQNKIDLLASSPQSIQNEFRFNLTPCYLTLQKPSSFTLTGDKEKQSQSTYLQEENKMLNDTLEKLLLSRSADKQRIRDLESYLYFSQKLYSQLVMEFLNGSTILQISKVLEYDLKTNQDIYCKYQESIHSHLMQLLRQSNFNQQSLNGQIKSEKESLLLLQIQKLRQRLALLQKVEHHKDNSRASLEVQNNRLTQQLQLAKKAFLQLEKQVERKNTDNKQLAIFWQKQNNQRKAVTSQLQKLKKQLRKSDQKYQLIARLQKDLVCTQHLLKQKQKKQANIQQNIKRLTEAIVDYREQNQQLKRQIKTLQNIKDNITKEQISLNKQTQNQLKTQLMHQTTMLRNYQQEINDLRNHLASVKNNQQMMLQAQAKQRQNQLVSQQIYCKKLNVIRTNSAIDHLWEVKETQYHNINELFHSLLQRQPKT